MAPGREARALDRDRVDPQGGSDQPVSQADERLLSRSAAAEYLGRPVSTIYQWARSGRLPCVVTLGGHLRFSRADLDAAQDAPPRPRRRSTRAPRAEPEPHPGPGTGAANGAEADHPSLPSGRAGRADY